MTKNAALDSTAFPANAPKCDVLVIEDEPLGQALILRYLDAITQSSHYRTLKSPPKRIQTLSFESGWDLLQADLSGVRVVVVDLLLPQVTGVDLIRDFRRRFPHLGIIPVSGMATDQLKRNLKDILPPQKNALLPKPLRKEDFFEAFVTAWNSAYDQLTQPHTPPKEATKRVPVGEAAIEAEDSTEPPCEELWTAVQITKENNVPVMRRPLLRKKLAA